MTVTLEDWSMITAMPIEGHALIGRVERTNWQQRVAALIGDCPTVKGNWCAVDLALGAPAEMPRRRRRDDCGVVREGLPVVHSHGGRVSRQLRELCQLGVSLLPIGLGGRVPLGDNISRLPIPFGKRVSNCLPTYESVSMTFCYI